MGRHALLNRSVIFLVQLPWRYCDPITAEALRFVKRLVSALEQRFEGQHAEGSASNSDAHANLRS
jgi:hypothetical protein